MALDIFDLNFELKDVILSSLAPAFINLGIFGYVFLFRYKSRINTFFSFFVFFLSLYQIADGFMKMSKTPDVSSEWSQISVLFLLIVMIFGVLFVMRSAGWHHKISNSILLFTLYLPAIISCILIKAKLNSYVIVRSDLWHWVAVPQPTPVTFGIVLWISFCAIIMITTLWLCYFREKKDEEKRRQYLLLSAGLTLPVVAGIITEIIFPMLLNLENIPLVSPCLTVFSVSALLAITEFHMLNYSPKHQWDIIVDSINEGILIVNNEDKIMYANTSFCKLVGYDFMEIKGKTAHQLFSCNSEVTIENTEETKSNKNKHQALIKAKTGKKLWVLISNTPYVDRKGKIIGTIAVHTNIDKIKTVKDDLRSVNKELEIYVYKASHDLRGPLASLLGLINVSKNEVKDEEALKYFNLMEKTVEKLDYTLGELVKGMKIKGIKIYEDSIDFEELIIRILNNFRHYPGYHRLKFTTSISVSKEFVSSRYIIETILQNLIENAIKYQNLSVQESILDINISDASGKIKIVVKDNGIGIANAIQSKVYEMYFRGTEHYKGSGLGLYLVKKAVEKLNGEIHLKSIEGKETVFTIVLDHDAQVQRTPLELTEAISN